VLSAVIAATFCGSSNRTNVPGEEQVYFLNLNLAISCHLGPQLVVIAYTLELKNS